MKCSICGKEFDGKFGDKYFPFCCERCQLIDLYEWLEGNYSIEQEEKEENDDKINWSY